MALADIDLVFLTFFIEWTCTYAHTYSMFFDLEQNFFFVRV